MLVAIEIQLAIGEIPDELAAALARRRRGSEAEGMIRQVPAAMMLGTAMLMGGLFGSMLTPATGNFPDDWIEILVRNVVIGAILAGIAWGVFAYRVFPPAKR